MGDKNTKWRIVMECNTLIMWHSHTCLWPTLRLFGSGCGRRSCNEIRIGITLTRKMAHCFASPSWCLMHPMACSISAWLKQVVGDNAILHILHIGLGNCLNCVKVMTSKQEAIYSPNPTHSLRKPPMHKWDTANIEQTTLLHSYLQVDISWTVEKSGLYVLTTCNSCSDLPGLLNHSRFAHVV